MLLRLEGCLSGNVPEEGLKTLPEVCTWFAQEQAGEGRVRPGHVHQHGGGPDRRGVQGQAGGEGAARPRRRPRPRGRLSKRRGDPTAEQERLAEQARSLVYAQFTEDTLRLALRYGLTSIPSLDNVDFVSQLVFDPSRGVGEPKARFAYLFPSNDAALIQIRLKPTLSDSQRDEAVDLIQEAVAHAAVHARPRRPLLVTGVPVVVDSLASAVQDSIFVLLGRRAARDGRHARARVPHPAAAAAARARAGGGRADLRRVLARRRQPDDGVDRGAAGADRPGGRLRIQFQARFEEVEATAAVPPPPAAAAVAAASAGGPTIATAGLSTAVGFLVLLLSPVPMVRGFGALLVIGIFVALGCALTAGFAALVRFSERRPDVPPMLPRVRATAAGWWEAIATSAPGSARRPRGCGCSAGWGRRRIDVALERPRRVLMVGLAVAALGWVADTQTEVISDVRELVPRDLQALKDVNELQEATGVSGEIDVTLSGDDLTDPKVIAVDDRVPARRPAGARVQGRVAPARRTTTRRSCARRCRCPTCSGRGRRRARRA